MKKPSPWFRSRRGWFVEVGKQESREALYKAIDASNLVNSIRQTGLDVQASDLAFTPTAPAGD